jgi:hypothetical protein
MNRKQRYWRYINHEGQTLHNIACHADGSLYNPNGYPDDLVRAAVAAAEEHQRQRRSEAAKQAAKTRQARKERLVYQAARRIIDGEVFGPRKSCFICKRGLGDPESIQRGIGSECWQFVLNHIKVAKTAPTPADA